VLTSDLACGRRSLKNCTLPKKRCRSFFLWLVQATKSRSMDSGTTSLIWTDAPSETRVFTPGFHLFTSRIRIDNFVELYQNSNGFVIHQGIKMTYRTMFDLSGLLVVLAVLQLLVVLEWIPLRSFVPSPWNLSVVLLMGFAAVIFLVIGGVMYSLADRHREA
jgi:hypothetical protein